jgi:hydrogenase large subunit
VGPLARMLVAYASPHERVRFWLDSVLGELELPTDALFSTLGRTISRGIETVVLAERVSGWLDELVRNTTQGDHTFRNPECGTVADWPREAAGFGWAEAPHGALCHSVQVQGGIIAHYRCLVPSAWNASPRDAGGQRGACEAALLSTPVVDSKRPIEVLRTLHAFDPCPVWAVHMTSPRPHEAVLVSGG